MSEEPIPETSQPPESADSQAENNGQHSKEMLGQFPPEIATLLIVAGVVGVLLPGPIGAPLLIAGGVVLWPKTFRPIEAWFSKKFPAVHQEGVAQLKEFIHHLHERFPENS